MPTSLDFDFSHVYAGVDGIDIPTALGDGRRSIDLVARPDTGAAYCVFPSAGIENCWVWRSNLAACNVSIQ